jgi:hypothetical protein
MPDITIVKKLKDEKNPASGHKLEPKAGRRTEVRAGETVTFTRGDGVEGLNIRFSDRSPFIDGNTTVSYDESHQVVPAVDPNPQRNRYEYSCETSDGISSEDGGEMIVTGS